MKIEKGQKYLCVKEGLVGNFNIGKIYPSNKDYIIIDNCGSEIEFSEQQSRFVPLSSAKWAIEVTKENAEILCRWANETRSDGLKYSPEFCVGGYMHSEIVSGIGNFYRLKKSISTEIDFETFKEITGMGEEKPKQLLGEKEAVHCPTLELAEEVIDILKENGANPSFDAAYYFKEKGDKLCFRTFGWFGFADKEFYQGKQFSIIPAEQFIKDNGPKIFTIEDVRNGKCAIENDGTVDDIKKVVNYIFESSPLGTDKFYFKNGLGLGWDSASGTDLPTQSVKLFLSQIEGEKEQPTEEWQPKWGEPVEVRDYDEQKWQKALFVGLNPNENQAKYITVRKDKSGVGIWSKMRQPIHEFTTEQAKQDLAKLHNLKPEQIKITD